MLGSVAERPPRYSQGRAVRGLPNIESRMPLEDMQFGYGGAIGSVAGSTRYPKKNQLELTFDANVPADGTITGGLQVTKIDGTVLSAYAVSRSYTGGSHNATMDALKTLLDALDADFTVTLSEDSAGNSKRVVTIAVGADKKLAVSTAFECSGTSAPEITPVFSSTDKVVGPVLANPNIGQNLDNTGAYYKAKLVMAGVVNDGEIAVPVSGTPYDGAPVYCLYDTYSGAVAGTFRPDDADGAAPAVLVDGARFTGTKDSDLAPVRFRY